MSNDQLGYLGTADATSGGSPYNESMFLIRQALAEISTAKLVQVLTVTNAGDLSPVGFVDVLPLVNQLDGSDNAVPHGTVHNLPYFRLQGGTDAVILDPKVGDIGLAVMADRDISAVKATKAQANPGSKRKMDAADGLYIGGYLNGTPQQYVRFSAAGIGIVSPSKITLSAPLVEIDASTSLTVNSPQSNFSGAVIIQGLLSWLAGMTGSTVSGVAALITGTINFFGALTSNGHDISSTHQHTNSGGSGLGGPPQ
ncbi:MAG: oxidoreductase [Paraburkholderia fungorum]|nr:oxidoreductase [Paraburkholderia fungorum]